MMTLAKFTESILESGRRVVQVLKAGKFGTATGNEVSPAGIDSSQYAGESVRAVYSETTITGSNIVIGYINNGKLSQPGETRIYSNSTSGTLITYIWLHNAAGAGQIEIGGTADNAVGYNQLETQFNILNGKFNDLVTAFNTHMHATAGTGPPVPPTPVPMVIPALLSTANIVLAKKTEIKTL
jgi:hypothetical protein